MPTKLLWTEPRDAQLKRLRAEGAAWGAIADELGISRNAAVERGRKIGARMPPPDHIPPPPDPDRAPLPPGHPISWGAITTGTLLHGTAYPDPFAETPAPAITLAAE